jgi:uncharacterized protein (TIGR03545 family)
MIRWSYILPRLAVLVGVAVVAWVCVDPLVRWSIVAVGQRVVEAQVEIGRVKTRLWNPEIRLTDVAVADPHDPMRNLFEASEIVLSFEGDSILRRKYVVREGRVSGLRLGTGRQTSGALDPAAPRLEWLDELPLEAIGDRVVEFGQEGLRCLAELLERNAAEQVERLESVRLARTLAQRWPAEYERMELRAESLKRRAAELRGVFQGDLDPKQVQRDPKRLLRDPEAIGRALTDLDQLLRELAEFRQEVERLARQAQEDRHAIETARDRDLDAVRRLVQPSGLSPERLSEHLLGPELGRRVVTLARWIHWTRQHGPEKIEDPKPVRGRGVDVVFVGIRQRPDFVLKQLAIDGQAEVDDEPFGFQGIAEDLATQPALYGKPARFRIEVHGKVRLQIDATIDRTTPVAREHLVVECPAIDQPPRALGKPGEFAVLVSPGSTRVSIVLDLIGDELAGRMTVRQAPVELIPDLGPRLAGSRFVENLQTALREIRAIEATVDVSGRIRQPAWTIQSDLGPQIARAASDFAQREYQAQKEEMIVAIQRRMDRELAQFHERVFARHDALAQKLNLTTDEVQQIRQLVAQRVPRADDLLKSKLPSELPLRF